MSQKKIMKRFGLTDDERSVIFLFGMLYHRFNFEDFTIPHPKGNYPDAKAKRGGKVLNIEFEAKSYNFVEHGHEVSECNLIICGEHDWKECPIEVLDLSEYVERDEEFGYTLKR